MTWRTVYLISPDHRFLAMIHVLLIEDDCLLRDSLIKCLGKAGYSVTQVSDGFGRLPRFNGDSPDLVIADVMMRDEEGSEALSFLSEQFPALPLLIIGDGHLSSSLQLGTAGWPGECSMIVKPFAPTVFLDAVQRLLRTTRRTVILLPPN
jgi:DNA-binding response OmpR family regulator